MNKYAAQSLTDLITPKQINAIYSIGRAKGINPAAESRRR